MKIQKIKTEEQYKEMLSLVETLMTAKKGSVESGQLELVVSVIEEYEEDFELAQLANEHLNGETVRINLDDLLADSKKSDFSITEEDREWLDSTMGKEKLAEWNDVKLRPFVVSEYLDSEEQIQIFLECADEENDPAYMKKAVQTANEARIRLKNPRTEQKKDHAKRLNDLTNYQLKKLAAKKLKESIALTDETIKKSHRTN